MFQVFSSHVNLQRFVFLFVKLHFSIRYIKTHSINAISIEAAKSIVAVSVMLAFVVEIKKRKTSDELKGIENRFFRLANKMSSYNL